MVCTILASKLRFASKDMNPQLKANIVSTCDAFLHQLATGHRVLSSQALETQFCSVMASVTKLRAHDTDRSAYIGALLQLAVAAPPHGNAPLAYALLAGTFHPSVTAFSSSCEGLSTRDSTSSTAVAMAVPQVLQCIQYTLYGQHLDEASVAQLRGQVFTPALLLQTYAGLRARLPVAEARPLSARLLESVLDCLTGCAYLHSSSAAGTPGTTPAGTDTLRHRWLLPRLQAEAPAILLAILSLFLAGGDALAFADFPHEKMRCLLEALLEGLGEALGDSPHAAAATKRKGAHTDDALAQESEAYFQVTILALTNLRTALACGYEALTACFTSDTLCPSPPASSSASSLPRPTPHAGLPLCDLLQLHNSAVFHSDEVASAYCAWLWTGFLPACTTAFVHACGPIARLVTLGQLQGEQVSEPAACVNARFAELCLELVCSHWSPSTCCTGANILTRLAAQPASVRGASFALPFFARAMAALVHGARCPWSFGPLDTWDSWLSSPLSLPHSVEALNVRVSSGEEVRGGPRDPKTALEHVSEQQMDAQRATVATALDSCFSVLGSQSLQILLEICPLETAQAAPSCTSAPPCLDFPPQMTYASEPARTALDPASPGAWQRLEVFLFALKSLHGSLVSRLRLLDKLCGLRGADPVFAYSQAQQALTGPTPALSLLAEASSISSLLRQVFGLLSTAPLVRVSPYIVRSACKMVGAFAGWLLTAQGNGDLPLQALTFVSTAMATPSTAVAATSALSCLVARAAPHIAQHPSLSALLVGSFTAAYPTLPPDAQGSAGSALLSIASQLPSFADAAGMALHVSGRALEDLERAIDAAARHAAARPATRSASTQSSMKSASTEQLCQAIFAPLQVLSGMVSLCRRSCPPGYPPIVIAVGEAPREAKHLALMVLDTVMPYAQRLVQADDRADRAAGAGTVASLTDGSEEVYSAIVSLLIDSLQAVRDTCTAPGISPHSTGASRSSIPLHSAAELCDCSLFVLSVLRSCHRGTKGHAAFVEGLASVTNVVGPVLLKWSATGTPDVHSQIACVCAAYTSVLRELAMGGLARLFLPPLVNSTGSTAAGVENAQDGRLGSTLIGLDALLQPHEPVFHSLVSEAFSGSQQSLLSTGSSSTIARIASVYELLATAALSLPPALFAEDVDTDSFTGCSVMLQRDLAREAGPGSTVPPHAVHACQRLTHQLNLPLPSLVHIYAQLGAPFLCKDVIEQSLSSLSCWTQGTGTGSLACPRLYGATLSSRMVRAPLTFHISLYRLRYALQTRLAAPGSCAASTGASASSLHGHVHAHQAGSEDEIISQAAEGLLYATTSATNTSAHELNTSMDSMDTCSLHQSRPKHVQHSASDRLEAGSYVGAGRAAMHAFLAPVPIKLLPYGALTPYLTLVEHILACSLGGETSTRSDVQPTSTGTGSTRMAASREQGTRSGPVGDGARSLLAALLARAALWNLTEMELRLFSTLICLVCHTSVTHRLSSSSYPSYPPAPGGTCVSSDQMTADMKQWVASAVATACSIAGEGMSSLSALSRQLKAGALTPMSTSVRMHGREAESVAGTAAAAAAAADVEWTTSVIDDCVGCGVPYLCHASASSARAVQLLPGASALVELLVSTILGPTPHAIQPSAQPSPTEWPCLKGMGLGIPGAASVAESGRVLSLRASPPSSRGRETSVADARPSLLVQYDCTVQLHGQVAMQEVQLWKLPSASHPSGITSAPALSDRTAAVSTVLVLLSGTEPWKAACEGRLA